MHPSKRPTGEPPAMYRACPVRELFGDPCLGCVQLAQWEHSYLARYQPGQQMHARGYPREVAHVGGAPPSAPVGDPKFDVGLYALPHRARFLAESRVDLAQDSQRLIALDDRTQRRYDDLG